MYAPCVACVSPGVQSSYNVPVLTSVAHQAPTRTSDMLCLVYYQCERLDSVAIPEYFAPPEVFSLASESRVTQWKSALEYGSCDGY